MDDCEGHFCILTDFDRTLTPHRRNGKKVSTSPSRFRDSGILGEEYTRASQALFDQYYPYEMDPDLSLEKKDSFLHAWWTKHLDLLVKH